MNPQDTIRVLQAVARDHVPADIDLLPAILAEVEKGNRSKMKLGTKLLIAFGLVALVVTVVLVSVPGAANAMRRLFGYIPGVGIVEQEAPVRVLARPVSLTRDGITLEVTAATLTADRTHIDYRLFGVPRSAFPAREDMMGCTTLGYLRLPDGRQIPQVDNDYGPIPVEVNEAVLVMPCILDTLPGTVPTDWELPLKFVPAPPGLSVAPVIDLSPSPLPSQTAGPAGLSGTTSTVQSEAPGRSLTMIKEIQTEDGYILVGGFSPQVRQNELFDGDMEIQDASGKKVAYTYPQDVGPNALGLDPNGTYWYVQFKAAGLAYPLAIRFTGMPLQPVDPGATAVFTFDAGPNPQPGQEWTPNQEIQLAGHTLKLLSIRADSRGGYSFEFQGDPQVYSADVQIEGHTPSGGGGGWGGSKGSFTRSVSFAQLPTGVLTVTLSNLTVTGAPLTWAGQWSPATPRTDLPVHPAAQPGLCLAADTLEQAGNIPPEMASGKALLYEPLEDGDSWGLVLYNLDGSQKQVITAHGNWGALSPDGKKVAYSAADIGIHLVDVETQSEQVLQNASGYDLHWSPDGKYIAYVTTAGVFVVEATGENNRQVSNLGYEGIVGWSPDGARLYFVAPYAGGAAWKVYALDLSSGQPQELFTIENGTPKFLDPTLSPDGRWIAYRGRDSSSLYLVRTDGSETHLVVDNAGVVGIEWARSGWLGASLRKPDSGESSLVVIKLDTCEAYRAPITPQADLEGLSIP